MLNEFPDNMFSINVFLPLGHLSSPSSIHESSHSGDGAAPAAGGHLSSFKLAHEAALQAAAAAAAAANNKPGSPNENAGLPGMPPAAPPAFPPHHLMYANPAAATAMLFNAQLALAAQHNPLLAQAYAANAAAGGIMANAARAQAQRFSPYSPPPPASSSVGATSPISAGSSGGSAFESVVPKVRGSSRTPSPAGSLKKEQLLSIDKMVNGKKD